MYESQEDMTSSWDIIFAHNWIDYTFHVLNKIKMLMMTLPNMFIPFSCHISYQNLINTVQECQQWSLVINSEYG